MDIPSIAISLDGKLEKNYKSACKLLDMIFQNCESSDLIEICLNINIPDINFQKLRAQKLLSLALGGLLNSIKTTSLIPISQIIIGLAARANQKTFLKERF